jgi:DNA polymerase-3 subunit alpha
MAIYENAVDSQTSLKKNEASGQVDLFGSLFDDSSEVINVPKLDEFEKREMLAMEKDMLGLYVSDHPLNGRERQLSTYAEMGISQFLTSEKIREVEVVTLAGLVTGYVSKLGRKSNKPYAMVNLEDFDGEIQFMLAGRSYDDNKELKPEQIIAVRGAVTVRDDERSLRVYEITQIQGNLEGENQPIEIRITDTQATVEKLEKLDRILSLHEGNLPVILHMNASGGGRSFSLARRARYSPGLVAELKALFGLAALSHLPAKVIEPDLGEDISGDDIGPLVVEQGSLFETE